MLHYVGLLVALLKLPTSALILQTYSGMLCWLTVQIQIQIQRLGCMHLLKAIGAPCGFTLTGT